MIDPFNITNYNRTDEELQEFILFGIAVAGKTAKIQAPKVNQFLTKFYPDKSPVRTVIALDINGELENALREVKLGKYNLLVSEYRDFANRIFNEVLDLRTCSIEELEEVHGIGRKTSRFFILHTRPDISTGVIDTHIIKWLDEKGYRTPSGQPSKKDYSRLTKAFLSEVNKTDLTPADMDLKIWKKYATR